MFKRNKNHWIKSTNTPKFFLSKRCLLINYILQNWLFSLIFKIKLVNWKVCFNFHLISKVLDIRHYDISKHLACITKWEIILTPTNYSMIHVKVCAMSRIIKWCCWGQMKSTTERIGLGHTVRGWKSLTTASYLSAPQYEFCDHTPCMHVQNCQ